MIPPYGGSNPPAPTNQCGSRPRHFRGWEKCRYSQRLRYLNRRLWRGKRVEFQRIRRLLGASLCCRFCSFRFRHPETGSTTTRDRLVTANTTIAAKAGATSRSRTVIPSWLCPRPKRLGRYSLPSRQGHRPGPGQPQHPKQSFGLRGIPVGRRTGDLRRRCKYVPSLGTQRHAGFREDAAPEGAAQAAQSMAIRWRARIARYFAAHMTG